MSYDPHQPERPAEANPEQPAAESNDAPVQPDDPATATLPAWRTPETAPPPPPPAAAQSFAPPQQPAVYGPATGTPAATPYGYGAQDQWSTAPSQDPYGQAPYGQAQSGQDPYGQAQYGQTQPAQTQYGPQPTQPPYAQPTYGQPAYTPEPGYGVPTASYPAYDQPYAYGQTSPYGDPGAGQPGFGPAGYSPAARYDMASQNYAIAQTKKSRKGLWIVLVLILVAACAAAAIFVIKPPLFFRKVLDPKAVATAIESDKSAGFTGVSCPSNERVKKGTTFTCTADGDRKITIVINDSSGNYTWTPTN